MANSVVIVDYSLGNLFNVQRALSFAGAEAVISADPGVVERADRVVLPGVGAFAHGMRELKARGLDDALRKHVASGRPLLGICLGMQLLMSESEEEGIHAGLDVVRGKVRLLRDRADASGQPVKVPEIGWNALLPSGAHPSWDGTVLRDLKPGASMYFLHSYYVSLEDQALCVAEAEYGPNRFCAVFERKNVIGIQPHPERSGLESGIAVLRRFMAL